MDNVAQLSIALDTELAANDADDQASRAYVDPRSIPSRFSLLKKMAISPAHYLEACQQPQDDSLAARLGAMAGTGVKRTEALRFGTAVHQFLLGQKDKIARYSGRRDPRVKAWQDFQADAAGRGCVEILNDREHAQASAVADAILRNPIAVRLLFDGTLVEQRIDWTYVGRAFRSTPDARTRSYVADLKSAVSAEPTAFVRQGGRLFYHAQAWLYAEAMEAAGEPRPADAYVIAVEKSRPMPVSILRFTEDALEQGGKLCRGWVERLNVCEATNTWPEYLEDIGHFDLGPPSGESFTVEWNGQTLEVA